ncbi:hypothetical protein EAY71_24545 [Vibrio anguillarum]|nr:hypothetical protein [Vibrio anguillarum]
MRAMLSAQLIYQKCMLIGRIWKHVLKRIPMQKILINNMNLRVMPLMMKTSITNPKQVSTLSFHSFGVLYRHLDLLISYGLD